MDITLPLLEPNPFYSEPESSEDEGIIDSTNLKDVSMDCEPPEDSSSHPAAFSNDTIETSSSESENDDDDDEGIIVLPAPPRDSPVVIDVDEESRESESRIIVEQVVEVRARSKSKGSPKKKNSVLKINQILSKGKGKEKYKEDYGSDFEENFLSEEDEDEEVDESGISLGNLMGSKDKTRTGGKRKVSELFAAELDEVKTKSIEKPEVWTSGMEKFYNKVDEQLMDIDLDKVLSKMSQDPKDWPVDRCDVYGGGRERARYFGGGKICHNCNQFGHQVRECPEPVKAVKCQVCGGEGHRENRCPERCCLRCGQPSFTFQESCSHCQRLNREECNESQKRKQDCWCCNCGSQGHLQDACKRPRSSKYPPTSLRVISYEQPKLLGGEEEVKEVTLKVKKMKKSR